MIHLCLKSLGYYLNGFLHFLMLTYLHLRNLKDYYGRYINVNIPSYIIPATVDTSKFDPHTKLENKEKLNISKKKLTVGTVANISPVKGIDKIIEVANYFKDNDGIEFIIIGQVPKTQSKYFNRLSKKIKTYNLKNIHFKNFKET